ncbi:MAG: hypothetical protein KKA73_11325 [Chloroflexi bacterium]|nr:hypothetical protein [Chloroflexota bacterium]MBU1748269.1 hypothetical protein [Chloroflexota bacterium]
MNQYAYMVGLVLRVSADHLALVTTEQLTASAERALADILEMDAPGRWPAAECVQALRVCYLSGSYLTIGEIARQLGFTDVNAVVDVYDRLVEGERLLREALTHDPALAEILTRQRIDDARLARQTRKAVLWNILIAGIALVVVMKADLPIWTDWIRPVLNLGLGLILVLNLFEWSRWWNLTFAAAVTDKDGNALTPGDALAYTMELRATGRGIPRYVMFGSNTVPFTSSQKTIVSCVTIVSLTVGLGFMVGQFWDEAGFWCNLVLVGGLALVLAVNLVERWGHR